MNSIDVTKADLIRTKDRMIELLNATPDDRLQWKPSPSSRSIIEIVAHSGNALRNIATQLSGTPYTVPTSAEANASFLEHDAQFQTREQAAEYLEENCQRYIGVLDSLSEADLGRMVILPFNLGEAPVGFFMGMGNLHTMGHIAQIEYVQTIYGDHDWHMGF